MDVVTFVEEHLGIELLPYQKKYLKWLSNQDTKHIYWITHAPETGYTGYGLILIREIMKRCLQKN